MRNDKRLPYSLQHDVIARLDGTVLLVGDRRRLPFERVQLPCADAYEAAAAIRGMVTQGGGPLEVSLWALVQTARINGCDIDEMRRAADALSSARPTNTAVRKELEYILPLIEDFQSPSFASDVEDLVMTRLDYYDACYDAMAHHGAALIEDGDGLLTTCFPEHSFFLSLYHAREEGRTFKTYAMETRPWLQGAHLTAPGLAELGYDSCLITDNMAAAIVSMGLVTKYMTASDRATASHWVINKLGTLSAAIACHERGVPYYAFSLTPCLTGPDPCWADVEVRDPAEVLSCQGMKTTSDSVRGFYPCFDLVPPRYVTAVVTKEGLL